MASNLSVTFAQVFIAETFKSFNDFEEKKKAAKLQEANISEEETVDDPSIITEDICYIWSRAVSREPLTEWTDCAKDCGRWFHTACIRHSGDSVQGYICNTC